MNNDLYYRASRQFTLTGSLVMLIAGGIAAVVLGFVYAYLIFWNPLIYINFLASIFFGLLMGAAATIGIRMGKVRWPLIAFLNGLIVGVLGLYVSWVVWLHAFLARAGAPGVWPFDPAQVLDLMRQIGETGAWSLRGSTPSGWFLFTIWAIEALIIVGACSLTCAALAGEPFCEECEAWSEDTKISKIPFGVAESVDQLRTALEGGDLDALARLAPPTEAGMNEVTLSACRTCGELGFLSVEQVLVKGEGKKAQAKRSNVVKHLLLDKEKIERLGDLVAAHVRALGGGDVDAGADTDAGTGGDTGAGGGLRA